MAKLTLNIGDIAIEYDGPEAFLKDQLSQIVQAVRELRPVAEAGQLGGAQEPKGSPEHAEDFSKASTSTLAQLLGAKSGPELIIAASLSLVKDGLKSFNKSQLRTKAREAKSYWKKSYGNNFDKYLGRLVSSGQLNHVGDNEYAIPEKRRKALDAKLSGTH